jgi:uncharacterized protein YdaU (DUF1376 family)
MQRPWMPFYVNDYLGDTEHLSTLQHGAYCLLLFSYWRRGGLPDDDQQLANITKLSLDDWLIHRKVLQAFFHSGWRHQRVDAELHRTAARIAKAREHGQKGGQMTAFNREKEKWQRQRLK